LYKLFISKIMLTDLRLEALAASRELDAMALATVIRHKPNNREDWAAAIAQDLANLINERNKRTQSMSKTLRRISAAIMDKTNNMTSSQRIKNVLIQALIDQVSRDWASAAVWMRTEEDSIVHNDKDNHTY
jgi:hypothetical protein